MDYFSFFVKVLGKNGVIVLTGILIFIFFFIYSQQVFAWIEKQTLETRNYIMEKLAFLYVDISEKKVVYILLSLSFGPGGIVCITFMVFKLWAVGLIFLALFAFLGFKSARPIINFFVAKRIKNYQNQMVDGLTLLANGIRAGLSVPQALGMVVDEMPSPISQEFNMILQQNKIGVPLEECFDNLGKRIPTEDNDMFISSINILRETGGNLAEVFDTIVGVIRERVRLQQKIDTFVAQGLFQGGVIFLMPFIMGVLYTINDPEAMIPLVTTPIGIIAILAAMALNLLGGFAILKIVKIKV